MTIFTRTWDAAYEAIPADSDLASEGANRIRDFKTDVQERGEVDHSWAGDADDGEHKKITFAAPLASDPANVANKAFLYTKDVSAKVELFWRDEDGDIVQLTAGGKFNPAIVIEAGTRAFFQQTAAPTGWTKDTTASLNDTGLRVVTGTVGSGGTDDFSTVFSSSKSTEGYQLVAADIPELTGNTNSAGGHTHGVSSVKGRVGSADGDETSTAAKGGGGTQANNQTIAGTTDSAGGHAHTVTVNSGGGQTHAHDITMDLKFNDCIIATKD